MSNEQQAHQQDVERVASEVTQAVADNSQAEVEGAILDAVLSGVAPEEVAAELGESEEQLGQDLDGVTGE